MTEGRNLAQGVGPLVGACYVAIGVLGFCVTGFDGWLQDTPDTLLGLAINPFANLAHVVIGGFLLFMTIRMPAHVAEGAVLGVGLFFIVAFVIDMTNPDNLSLLSMRGGGDVQKVHHAVTGGALLALGLLSARQSEAARHRGHRVQPTAEKQRGWSVTGRQPTHHPGRNKR